MKSVQIILAAFLALGRTSIAQVVEDTNLQSVVAHASEQITEENEQSNLRTPLNRKVEKDEDAMINANESERRQLFSWATLFRYAIHPPHLPHNSGGSSGGSSSGGSSSGGSSGGSSSGGSSGGGTSAATSSGGDGNGGSSSATSSSGGEGNAAGGGSRATLFTSSSANLTMLVIAAAAAGAAIGAVVMGRKQQTVKSSHPLRGGLNKRINLFSNFANKSSAKVERPDRLVEMTSKGDEAGYVRA